MIVLMIVAFATSNSRGVAETLASCGEATASSNSTFHTSCRHRFDGFEVVEDQLKQSQFNVVKNGVAEKKKA